MSVMYGVVDMFTNDIELKIDNTDFKIGIDELQSLPMLASQYEASSIHLFGNQKYVEGLAQKMRTNTQYNNITIEVN